MIKQNSWRNTNKDWSIGAKVTIGFMRNLEVLAVRAVKDGMPDIYTLVCPKGRKYEFMPYNGLTAI